MSLIAILQHVAYLQEFDNVVFFLFTILFKPPVIILEKPLQNFFSKFPHSRAFTNLIHFFLVPEKRDYHPKKRPFVVLRFFCKIRYTSTLIHLPPLFTITRLEIFFYGNCTHD